MIYNQIDLALLKIACPGNSASELSKWVAPLRAACKEFGIDTVREVASFLANISVESMDLRRSSENLNYSVGALLKMFGRHRISAADAHRLGRKPGEGPLSPARQRALANILYGGSWGKRNLGNINPDDGWVHRGVGPMQLTGRSNHERLSRALGIPLRDIPDYLRTRTGGARSAGWFWKTHNLDAKAATPGVEDDRKAINGGYHGLSTVRSRFNALITELLRRGC